MDTNDLFWALVYADSCLTYIREHYPDIYEECGDSEFFRGQRENLLAQNCQDNVRGNYGAQN
jgi:hypothetical protein